MAASGGVVAQNKGAVAQQPTTKPLNLNVTNPYMKGPTQAQINAQPGTSTGIRHADQLGWAKQGTQPTPYVAPPITQGVSRPAPAAPPAPVAPPAPAVPGASANAGIGAVASEPTPMGGAGGAAVVAPSVQALMDRADMGGISGDMGGQMRMLGQRMPSAESLALAGLGRKVY